MTVAAIWLTPSLSHSSSILVSRKLIFSGSQTKTSSGKCVRTSPVKRGTILCEAAPSTSRPEVCVPEGLVPGKDPADPCHSHPSRRSIKYGRQRPAGRRASRKPHLLNTGPPGRPVQERSREASSCLIQEYCCHEVSTSVEDEVAPEPPRDAHRETTHTGETSGQAVEARKRSGKGHFFKDHMRGFHSLWRGLRMQLRAAEAGKGNQGEIASSSEHACGACCSDSSNHDCSSGRSSLDGHSKGIREQEGPVCETAINGTDSVPGCDVVRHSSKMEGVHGSPRQGPERDEPRHANLWAMATLLNWRKEQKEQQIRREHSSPGTGPGESGAQAVCRLDGAVASDEILTIEGWSSCEECGVCTGDGCPMDVERMVQPAAHGKVRSAGQEAPQLYVSHSRESFGRFVAHAGAAELRTLVLMSRLADLAYELPLVTDSFLRVHHLRAIATSIQVKERQLAATKAREAASKPSSQAIWEIASTAPSYAMAAASSAAAYIPSAAARAASYITPAAAVAASYITPAAARAASYISPYIEPAGQLLYVSVYRPLIERAPRQPPTEPSATAATPSPPPGMTAMDLTPPSPHRHLHSPSSPHSGPNAGGTVGPTPPSPPAALFFASGLAVIPPTTAHHPMGTDAPHSPTMTVAPPSPTVSPHAAAPTPAGAPSSTTSPSHPSMFSFSPHGRSLSQAAADFVQVASSSTPPAAFSPRLTHLTVPSSQPEAMPNPHAVASGLHNHHSHPRDNQLDHQQAGNLKAAPATASATTKTSPISTAPLATSTPSPDANEAMSGSDTAVPELGELSVCHPHSFHSKTQEAAPAPSLTSDRHGVVAGTDDGSQDGAGEDGAVAGGAMMALGDEEVSQLMGDEGVLVVEGSIDPHCPVEWFVVDEEDSNTRVFVIQGSDSLASWHTNLSFEPVPFEDPLLGVLVHGGIYQAAKGLYKQLLPLIRLHLRSDASGSHRPRLRFVGHSLGGSLATLVLLLLLIRGELKKESLDTVFTFGSPSILCGGDRLLTCLGLSPSQILNVVMHRDIVPKVFACDYPDHVTEVLRNVRSGFRDHPCLLRQRLLYTPAGSLLALQPDERQSPSHPLLPRGPGLYHIRHPENSHRGEAAAVKTMRLAQLRAAQRALLNSPHPLEILADAGAYGNEGAISRDHDPRNYTKALNQVLRAEVRRARRLQRERRRQMWWPLIVGEGTNAAAEAGVADDAGLKTRTSLGGRLPTLGLLQFGAVGGAQRVLQRGGSMAGSTGGVGRLSALQGKERSQRHKHLIAFRHVHGT